MRPARTGAARPQAAAGAMPQARAAQGRAAQGRAAQASAAQGRAAQGTQTAWAWGTPAAPLPCIGTRWGPGALLLVVGGVFLGEFGWRLLRRLQRKCKGTCKEAAGNGRRRRAAGRAAKTSCKRCRKAPAHTTTASSMPSSQVARLQPAAEQPQGQLASRAAPFRQRPAFWHARELGVGCRSRMKTGAV